jgi:RNA polymerase sigma factor (sigma-70 family)
MSDFIITQAAGVESSTGDIPDFPRTDAEVEELFVRVVEPSIRSIINSRMGTSGNDAERSEAEDLASAIRLKIVQIVSDLNKLDEKEHLPIHNFEAYIRTVAHNEFRQMLRDKYPMRLRLKNKVRYILEVRSEFAIWNGQNGETVCGLAEWKDKKTAHRPASEGLSIFDAATQPSFENNTALLRSLQCLFEALGHPLTLDDAITVLGNAIGLKSPLDADDFELVEGTLAADARSVDQRFDDRDSLRLLWSAISQIPVNHRRALLLNLRGDHGENALVYFPVAGIASVRAIAQAVEIEELAFAKMWNELPLEDNRIAGLVGCTRQQVINLRQSARAKLARLHKGK